MHILAPPDDRRHRPVEEPVSHDGPCMHRVVRPWRFLEWAAVGEVSRVASAVRPDVVVERFYTFGGAGVWAAHRLGIPAVLEVNSPARPYAGSWRDRLDRISLVRPVQRWRRQVLEWSTAIYATSKHLLPPDLQDDVTVVTNGVDTDLFHPGPVVSSGPLRCVYVSSFRAWHGAEDLVQAVALCRSHQVDLRITCLGTGPRWAAARQAAARANVLDVMEFVGNVSASDVPRYLAEADVGLAPVSPADFSALQLGWFWSPIKIFEYLAAGLTVVTIGIDELRALLPESVARFYTAGDIPSLADRLSTIASNPTGVRGARDTARRLAVSRYSWAQQATAVEGLLSRAVAESARLEA